MVTWEAAEQKCESIFVRCSYCKTGQYFCMKQMFHSVLSILLSWDIFSPKTGNLSNKRAKGRIYFRPVILRSRYVKIFDSLSVQLWLLWQNSRVKPTGRYFFKTSAQEGLVFRKAERFWNALPSNLFSAWLDSKLKAASKGI